MASPTVRPESPAETLMRASSGLTLRQGDNKISDPVSSTFTHHSLWPEQMDALYQEGTHRAIDGTWPRKSMPALHLRDDGGPSTLLDMDNRNSLGPSIIMSSMSSVPSKTSLSQKKPHGLRATIKRMFGSKRHRSQGGETKRGFDCRDVGDLMTVGQFQNVSQGSSQPQRPVTRSSALGSHAPSMSTRYHKIGTEELRILEQPHKRRNTLPSLALSEHEAQDFSRSLNFHLSRPDGEYGNHNDNYGSRRSRSADALTQQYTMQDSKVGDRPDRSSQIAYWRNSVLLNPLPELVHSASLEDATGSSYHNDQWATPPQPHSAIKPIQSFDFGLSVGDEPIDLEERVNTLEVKVFDFEYAIAKLQGVDIPKPVLPLKVTKRKSVHDVFPMVNQLSSSTLSSLQSDLSFAPPEDLPLESLERENEGHPDRTSKANTIRPSTTQRAAGRSGASSPTSVRLTHDQFDKLLALIQDEKAARQQIEMQLMELQKEVELLQAPVYASIRPLNYQTSSPESYTDTSLIHRSKKLHRSPPFEFAKPPTHNVSRFSMADSDADSESYGETYETPKEHRFLFETSRGSPLLTVN